MLKIKQEIWLDKDPSQKKTYKWAVRREKVLIPVGQETPMKSLNEIPLHTHQKS